MTREYILKKYNDVFSGIGPQQGDEYHIKLKKDYEPVQHPPWSVPVKLKPAYKEIQQLYIEGITTPVWEHTEWTNSIVSARMTNGSLRLCLDPKDFIENIGRSQYYTGPIDDLNAELYGSKYFTLMDAKSGY